MEMLFSMYIFFFFTFSYQIYNTTVKNMLFTDWEDCGENCQWGEERKIRGQVPEEICNY